MNRRKFLGAFAAAPVAAKQVAADVAKRAGIAGGMVAHSVGRGPVLASGGIRSMWDIVQKMGGVVPKFMREEWKREAKNGAALGLCHPDIEALRSVSPTVKARMQARQSYRTREREFWEDGPLSSERDAFWEQTRG